MTFDYIDQFWSKYQDVPKVLAASFMEGHEVSGAVLQLLDDPLNQLLNAHVSDPKFNNTIIFIVADHGSYYGTFLRPNNFEHDLPLLLVSLPANFRELYPQKAKNLFDNRQLLLTGLSIYDTIMEIADIENPLIDIKYNKSLFKLQDMEDRKNCTHMPEIEFFRCLCNGGL